ncbi:unnamed protein product [Amoebophrya sp. A25]|nr:unnamed protein product [Amoebophrya sp. A25]|eukprot:GSA25T00008899001.1
MSDEAVTKFHSAVRWGKEIKELEPMCTPDLVNAADPKNGNRAIHISAQNGHQAITEWLVSKGADVNAQNNKGQTPLHMSVEYDFYYQNVFLMEKGASKDLKNGEGHPAILGIDGGKTGHEAWDNPMTLLKSVSDKESMDAAFKALEGAKAEDVDKAVLAQTGMKKKKMHADFWDAKQFMSIISKF